MTFPLTAYIEAALEMAHYDKLEDGSFAGEIPKLKGVIAFAKSLRECENKIALDSGGLASRWAEAGA